MGREDHEFWETEKTIDEMKSLRKRESGRCRYYMVGSASYEGGRAQPLRWRGKGKGWILM